MPNSYVPCKREIVFQLSFIFLFSNYIYLSFSLTKYSFLLTKYIYIFFILANIRKCEKLFL